MFFRDIIGQEEVKQRLIKSANEGIVPHAHLFAGAEGVGKLLLAIAYARYINCLKPTDEDACGECQSCVKYNTLAHPDLHFVFPIVKKGNRDVCDDFIPQWREILQSEQYFSFSQWLAQIEAGNSQGVIYTKESDEILRKLSLKVYEAKYKVMIIWMPERMHEAGANSLLKILEEPTGNTVFILVSADPEKIIGTILSRSQRLNIPTIAENSLSEALVSRYNIDATAASNLAHLAKGSFLNAKNAINHDENNKLYFDLFIQMMRASYARDIKQIKVIGDKLAEIGRERQRDFLAYAQRMVREYFVSNLQKPEIVYLSAEEQEFGNRFAPFVNEKNIIGLMEELALAERHIEQNVYAKMVFFDLCLKITMLIKQN